jgi:hypothetical protein
LASAQQRQRREYRYGLMVAAGLFVFLAAAVGLTSAMTGWPVLPGQSVASTAPRTAHIVFDPATDRCRQILFDNDTGRSSGTMMPCPEVAATGSGKALPAPSGTVRRLDAISKSFSKQER